MADLLPSKVEFLLRLGDSTLVLAQQLVQWCGHGPALEEDMANSNVGLDLLGQTRLWYGYAAELEGRGRSEDDLAFLRDAHEYRNVLLVEMPNGDYAMTVARQFLFDSWHHLFLGGLVDSADARLAEIAAKSLKEVTYHARRSADLVVRLGDGTPESRRRMQDALLQLWPYTGELFATDVHDERLVAAGDIPDAAQLLPAWRARVGDVLAEAALDVPGATWMHSGGRSGRHTEHLGFLLAEMQFLQRAYPEARW